MKTKNKQLQGLFQANEAAMGCSAELHDMKELFAYSFDDFSNQLDSELAQSSHGTEVMF